MCGRGQAALYHILGIHYTGMIDLSDSCEFLHNPKTSGYHGHGKLKTSVQQVQMIV